MIERRIGAVVGALLTVFFYRLASHRLRKDKRVVRRWRMAKRAFSYCVKIQFLNQANLQSMRSIEQPSQNRATEITNLSNC